jgi:nitroreductase
MYLTYAVDVSIAFAYMLPLACEPGLGTCWIGIFREDEVKSILGVPNPLSRAGPEAMLATGKPQKGAA